MLYLQLFGAWVKGCQSQRGKRRPDESSLKKGRIGESLPGGHLHSWLSFETKVYLGMVQAQDRRWRRKKMEPTRSCFLEEETPGSVYEYGLCYSR